MYSGKPRNKRLYDVLEEQTAKKDRANKILDRASSGSAMRQMQEHIVDDLGVPSEDWLIDQVIDEEGAKYGKTPAEIIQLKQDPAHRHRTQKDIYHRLWGIQGIAAHEGVPGAGIPITLGERITHDTGAAAADNYRTRSGKLTYWRRKQGERLFMHDNLY